MHTAPLHLFGLIEPCHCLHAQAEDSAAAEAVLAGFGHVEHCRKVRCRRSTAPGEGCYFLGSQLSPEEGSLPRTGSGGSLT